MENTEKKPYETPEIQVVELDAQRLLVVGSPERRYVPNYSDDIG